MFKLKYNLHRIVNIIFDGLFFLLGFLLGGGYNYEKFKEVFLSLFFN